MSNRSNQPDNMSRRHFMRQAACAALGATAMVNTLSAMRLTSAAIAQSSAPFTDYKAMVCLFLEGGNDSNNMLVPIGTDEVRQDYEVGRSVLALNRDELHTINVSDSTAAFGRHYGGTVSPMGIHPDAPDIASLFNNGDLAFVCNVGTLSEQILTRSDYINKTVKIPQDLFSHSNQQMQWQTTVSDRPIGTGWGGRMAQELLHEGRLSDDSKVSISLSMDGINTFQRGDSSETAAFTLSNGIAKRLNGFGTPTDPYGNAYHSASTFDAPNYKDNRAGNRLKAVETLLQLTNDNLLEDTYASRLVTNRQVSNVIDTAIATANSRGINFDQIFEGAKLDPTNPNEPIHDLGKQLKDIAHIIAGRSVLGNNRQIFFVRVSGYDIHTNHLAAHSQLMKELSTGLIAFRNALQAIGDWDKVLTFTASDFSRTLSPNSPNGSSGTDHAWGGHAMVMGGPVVGGKLYGHFPSLKMGDHPESIDAHNGRGRWIPSTSVDQYSAVMTKWFGADSMSMEAIFPNLGRFENPLESAANLQFIQGL